MKTLILFLIFVVACFGLLVSNVGWFETLGSIVVGIYAGLGISYMSEKL